VSVVLPPEATEVVVNNALSQLPPDDVLGVAVKLRALVLVFVSVTPDDETWLPVPAKVMDVGLAVRTLLVPPPPPPLVPLKVTVIVTSATPVGEVGCSKTVAEAPLLTPAVVRILKDRVDGVVVPPDTASQFVFVEPEVSPE
jgi:hypothetical protein